MVMVKSMKQPDGHAEVFRAPFSGQILGVLVKELQLQINAPSSKTAQRYFSGIPVSSDSELEILEAIGKLLADAEILPPLPPLQNQEFSLSNVISTAVAWYADRWDELVGYMRSISAPVERPDLAAISYLRLAVIDLALRTSALVWLAELPTPDEGRPLWAEEKGGAKFLRQLLERCGEARPTRDRLSERLGVTFNTLDSWLDTEVRPSESNICGLAKELSSHIPGYTADALGVQLRRHYTLCDICDLLARYVGRDAVLDLAAALTRFTSRNVAGLREYSKLTQDDAASAQFVILLLGSQFASTEYLLRALWRRETDAIWKTDLLAASRPWHLRLQHIAQHLGGLNKAVQIAQDEFGIPQSESLGLMERVAHSVQADLTRFHISDPSELEGMTVVRIRGDAKFSARNRMIQYAQARAEGDLPRAILNVSRAVKLQPENAEYRFHLGATLGTAGDIEGGIHECWISAQLEPTWDLPRVEIGIILLNASRHEEAKEHLEATASSLGEMTPHLAFNLGVARLRCNDPSGALHALEKCIESKPDHALALDVAAHCAFMAGDRIKGQRLAKLAQQLGHSETYRDWRQGKYGKRRKPSS